MFKTDKDSLNDMAFRFSEWQISNFSKIFDDLDKNGLLTLSEKERMEAKKGLKEIVEMQMSEKVYGFNVKDTYLCDEGFANEGIELYLRRGEGLRDYYVSSCRPDLYSSNKIISFLKENDISRIYAGVIEENFFGLSELVDEEDPIYRNILSDSQIKELRKSGIEVIVLEKLD